MNKELVRHVGDSTVDNLLAYPYERADTTGIYLAPLSEAGVIRRGTVLAANGDGTYSAFAGSAGEEKFSGDGVTTKFTLTGKPETITSVTVGSTSAAVAAYNAFTGEMELAAAPAAGTDNVVVNYAVPGTKGVPSMILADTVEVGTEEAAAAVAYKRGNFNPAALILPEGYELTDADLDAFRHYQFDFTQML